MLELQPGTKKFNHIETKQIVVLLSLNLVQSQIWMYIMERSWQFYMPI